MTDLLNDILRLTKEQRGLIYLEDKEALEANIEQKARLIEALRGCDGEAGDAVLAAAIADAERENIAAVKDEMARLKDMLKRTQDGMTAVRGYDAYTSNAGATYIDKKQ